ncbi:BgTH12-02909 [Blumeria graminis f. sp. triticale]|uniref:Protein N-terminal and lysine N-methyltransferase EFM7 n=3 Tax=Blumeria graminis TaxID=34373 RepID=A0A061HGZ6_BLUGR|nr:nicotinamide N-methyltransferase [Blumeria graminis f. sp. tritici 96224]CAD6503242.1 BgTH12-02909 [Blumeria graminis f. sp. triticale]VDB89229.1 Bgt-3453 [Blumeria graminis f. sp. tritici]
MNTEDISTHDDLDLELTHDMFTEPAGYYTTPRTATSETYTLSCGRTLHINLVGENPLWGHYLWNGARRVSTYLEEHPMLVRGQTILELGAGGGLPSLVSAHLGAACVVMTDYPDADLVQNLARNAQEFNGEVARADALPLTTLIAQGFCWGTDCEELLKHLPDDAGVPQESLGYDVVILADLLFNHSEHAKLLATLQGTLKKKDHAKALVFFTPYRPWLLPQDMAFFDLVRAAGMSVEKVIEEKTERAMFEEDPGDEELRKTVFGYIVKWSL